MGNETPPRRWHRFQLALALAIALVACIQSGLYVLGIVQYWDEIKHLVAVDHDMLIAAADRWLNGGPFYEPDQVAGLYNEYPGAWIQYPPTMLLVFVPSVWLGPLFYWGVPIAIIAAMVVWHRPRPLALAIIALALANPTSITVLIYGNPAIWFAAALALGTRWHWPSVAVFLKPTLLPFAFVGSWHRSWWLGLAALALLSIPFMGLWYDWIRVALNNHHPSGILYSLPQVPLMLIPVIAWLGSPRLAAYWQQRLSGVSLREAWAGLPSRSLGGYRARVRTLGHR